MGDKFRPGVILAGALAMCGAVAADAAPAPRGLHGEFGAGFDSNVANVRQGGDTREDSFLQLGATAETGWRLGPGMAMQWQLHVDAQGYGQYPGLSHADPGVRWRWLYRPGSGFFAPVVALQAAAALHEYDSRLRDAAEYRFGLWVQQQLTTRIALRGAWFASRRESRRQDVFDGGVRSATINLDWQPARDWAVYLGYQYVDGDLVSTAADPPARVLDAARASAPDDVFDGETAFRLSSSAHAGTLGVNRSLSQRLSIDVLLRHIDAEADLGSHYRREQVLASLLWRY